MRSRRFVAVPLAALFAVLSVLIVTPARADDPATVTGAACGPNEGVTIVVDFAPTTDEVKLGCAQGAQDTLLGALDKAGFEATTEVNGFGNFLCAVDGVAANPADCQAFPGPYWAGWVNTTDGEVGSPAATAWASAQFGVDGGPLRLGSVVGFNLNTDGAFPGAAPRASLADLPQPSNEPVTVPGYGPGDGSATAAAGWIGRQLVAGNGLLGGSVGPTVDAIYTLAAAGIGGDAIAQSAAAVRASGTAYIGAADAVATKFAQIAKTAFALQIAGLDPTDFPDGAGGTRDLLAELRSVLNPDGSFGTTDDPFLHAFALLALSRTAAGVPESAVAWLEAQQCTDPAADGAFGFNGCASADPDYTALALDGLLAAGSDPADPVVTKAVGWLTAQQADDGGLAGNTNSTGVGGQALAAAGATAAAVKGAGFIGGLQVTCDTVLEAGSALTAENVGAIPFTAAALTDGKQFGIDAGNLGQWQFATVQAVFGLGAPALGQLTAVGVDPALPAAATCAPPTTSEPTPTVEPSTTAATSTPTATSTAAVTTTAPTTTKPGLASTGVSDRTLPEVLIAVVLLIAGIVLVLVARRGRSVERHR